LDPHTSTALQKKKQKEEVEVLEVDQGGLQE
jgi:hypothetical protein